MRRTSTDRQTVRRLLLLAVLAALPASALAAWTTGPELHWTAWLALAIFGIGYSLVLLEERLGLRKSVPMILAAGLLWILVAVSPAGSGAGETLRAHLLEFAELFLFILAAVTYVNTLEERQLFDALRSKLIAKGLSYRAIFWATGLMAFAMSPVADNLTTTLVMGAVAISVGAGAPKFTVPACVNIVVAANAGGTFSPFGDITTLMVWQGGKVEFGGFFALLVPALVNWIIPAALMSWAVPVGRPTVGEREGAKLLPGAWVVLAMFIATIALTVVLHNAYSIPSAVGMMTGFGALHLYSHLLRRATQVEGTEPAAAGHQLGGIEAERQHDSFDVFGLLARVEWDTMMFFYGVMLCVGALGALGLLEIAARSTYGAWGPTAANSVMGLSSAVFDNIPLMAAVLSVSPRMGTHQWLLATLAAGVGGSLLSVGSAAGVALMGQARKVYTFTAHLKWTWAVALGYGASIWVHLLLNGR